MGDIAGDDKILICQLACQSLTSSFCIKFLSNFFPGIYAKSILEYALLYHTFEECDYLQL